jgi:hypothetical protein
MASAYYLAEYQLAPEPGLLEHLRSMERGGEPSWAARPAPAQRPVTPRSSGCGASEAVVQRLRVVEQVHLHLALTSGFGKVDGEGDWYVSVRLDGRRDLRSDSSGAVSNQGPELEHGVVSVVDQSDRYGDDPAVHSGRTGEIQLGVTIRQPGEGLA